MDICIFGFATNSKNKAAMIVTFTATGQNVDTNHLTYTPGTSQAAATPGTEAYPLKNTNEYHLFWQNDKGETIQRFIFDSSAKRTTAIGAIETALTAGDAQVNVVN